MRMLPRVVVVALALALPVVVVAQQAEGKKVALIVGVRDYDHNDLPALKYTENDAEGLDAVLRDNGYTVRVLSGTRGKTNKNDLPTTANIRKALEELMEAKTRRDTVLIALSGHGIQLELEDPDGREKNKTYGYFCPSDADFAGVVYKTGKAKRLIPLDDMFAELKRCGAGTKNVLIDACRNELTVKGASRSIDAGRVTVPDGIAALFSCGPGQRAWEAEKLKHGVFFHYVLEGLKGKAKNDKGDVTWLRLAAYVTEQVSEQVPELIGGNAKQTPHAVSNQVGSAVLTRVGGKGWVSLFNGKDISGWTVSNAKEKELWEVNKDGHLVGAGGRSHLFTVKDDYKNFRLRVEAKINETGNSGVYARAAPGRDFPTGYETQITVVKSQSIKTGGLWIGTTAIGPKAATAPHKADTWFVLFITCEGNRIRTTVYGDPVADHTDEKALFRRGQIALQIHDPQTVVTFRKIEIKELPDDK